MSKRWLTQRSVTVVRCRNPHASTAFSAAPLGKACNSSAVKPNRSSPRANATSAAASSCACRAAPLCAHKDESVHAPAGFGTGLSQCFEPAPPIGVLTEDLLPVVAARPDVVNRARELDAQGPCHRPRPYCLHGAHVKEKCVIILGPTPSQRQGDYVKK